MSDRVLLCIGTKKGLFVAEAAKSRRRFALRGPFGAGVSVYSALVETRGTPRIYASSCNAFFGMKVLRSTNLGKTFTETKAAPAFPRTTDARSSTSGRSKAATTKRSCGAVSSRPRFFTAKMAAIPGR